MELPSEKLDDRVKEEDPMLKKELATYLMEQFERINDVTSRPMMGGYVAFSWDFALSELLLAS